jgi:ADP-ribosyl-[dinitrogen reductase] hydrolase
MSLSRRDRFEGLLLGTALGDALGLPAEGLSGRSVVRRFGALERFHLVGRTGFVSDDTEQAALLAEALVPDVDEARVAGRFGRSLVSWFLRLPFGIGLATIRACVRRLVGLRPSGVLSAGNGAAMRAAVVGARLATDAAARRSVGRAVATVTHRHPAGVEGALYVAELTAALMQPAADVEAACVSAAEVVSDEGLATALARARHLPLATTLPEAVKVLGNTGWVVHTAALATFCLRRHPDDAMGAIRAAIHCGGDTDSIAAIVGAWVGTRLGAGALDAGLLEALHDGPFGPTHLRALALALDGGAPQPGWSWFHAMARNLALYPVVLAHGFRRLLPW